MRGLRDGDTGLWSRPVASQQLDEAYAAAHGPPPGSPGLRDASARIKRCVSSHSYHGTTRWEASAGSLQMQVGEAHAAACGEPGAGKLLHQPYWLALPTILMQLGLLLHDC